MQITEITTLFNTLDRNDDGQVTLKEMKKSLNSLSAEQKDAISFLIKDNGKVNKSSFYVLANGDKKLNQNDLLSYLTTKDDEGTIVELSEEQEASRDNVLGIISNADKKKDGKLTKNEIKKAYNKAVKNNDTETVEYLEKFMTTNSKGKKVVDKAVFNYLSTTGVVKKRKDTGFSTLWKTLGAVGGALIGNVMSAPLSGGGIGYVIGSTIGSSKDWSYYTKATSLNDLVKFDNDGDYDLSESEMELLNEYKDFFYTIDTKQDGRISEKDIVRAYKNAPDGSDLKTLLSSLVTVSDKGKVKINKANFRTLAQGKDYLNSSDMLHLKTDDTTAALTNKEITDYLNGSQEFQALDSNGNGKLTLKEIKKAAKNGTNSQLVKYLTSIDNSKEMKRIFKLISNGGKYITAANIKEYDTDKNGTFSTEEINEMINKLTNENK